ncbi:MAG: aminodeoxychorismate/anthranilate synthase component II [Dysgonamonadaceae bacterium]|jgi:anthranilate synthase component 2|nr:aminodeoxychorismate/anthranilate synthase component II [Dysgonamonadaceae bacterium]
MKILVFDNYDSFTYNLVELIKMLGYDDIEVHRNDKIPLDRIAHFDKIILSPGPGIPSESGLLLPLIRHYAPTKHILGVCLGHQAIAESFGAKLINLSHVYHGIATPIGITIGNPILKGMPEIFQAGRYHSWIVDKAGFPLVLEINAIDQDGKIMALRHRQYNVYGVQFHPESILTPLGKHIVKNFLELKVN